MEFSFSRPTNDGGLLKPLAYIFLFSSAQRGLSTYRTSFRFESAHSALSVIWPTKGECQPNALAPKAIAHAVCCQTITRLFCTKIGYFVSVSTIKGSLLNAQVFSGATCVVRFLSITLALSTQLHTLSFCLDWTKKKGRLAKALSFSAAAGVLSCLSLALAFSAVACIACFVVSWPRK